MPSILATPSAMSSRILPRLFPAVILASVLLLLGLAPNARAQGSYFGGSLRWTQTGEKTIQVEITETLRRGLFPSATVGSTISNSWTLDTGSGAGGILPYSLVVTSIDVPRDKIVASTTITKTYGSSGTYTLSTSTCCRPTALTASNGFRDFRMSAQVILAPPIVGSQVYPSSPRVRMPDTILRSPTGAPFSFKIPAEDPEGDTIGYRFATGVESSLLNPIPSGATLDPQTGVLSMPAQPTAIAHAAQIILDDGEGTSCLDLYLDFTAHSPAPPTFTTFPAGGELTAYVGVPLEFQIVASDPGVTPNDAVDLRYGPLPAGLELISAVSSTPFSNTRTLTFRCTLPVDAPAESTILFQACNLTGNDSSYSLLRLKRGVASTIHVTGTLRDFKSAHADFDLPNADADTRFVQTALGADRKPVFLPAAGLTSTRAETFPQWWNTDPLAVYNLATAYTMTLSNGGQANPRTYQGKLNPYPIDNLLFGNEGQPHNGFYTYEANTYFIPQAGDVMTFRSSDDLWVFIDGRLVLDLGGIHGVETGTVDPGGTDLNGQALNLAPGEFHKLDLFYAHRGQHAPLLEIELLSTAPGSGCEALPEEIPPLDPQSFQLAGTATRLGDGTLELFGPGDPANTSSAVWLDTPLPLTHGFSLNFEFEASPETPGFALVLADPGTPVTATGSPGIQLGYGGLPGTLALEFDAIGDPSWDEPFIQVNSDHIALHSLGHLPNTSGLASRIASVGLANQPTNVISNGNVHRAELTFAFSPASSETCKVILFIDRRPELVSPDAVFNVPKSILAQVCGDPSGETFGPLRLGFTSSTSPAGTNASSKLRIRNLQMFTRSATKAKPAESPQTPLVRGQQQVELFYTADTCNNPIIAPGRAADFTATFTREGSGESVPVNVTDLGDGTYGLDYTPTLTGQWSLAVNFDGEPAAGSPYALTVISPYAAWANANFDAATPAGLRDPEDDPDGDGLANGLEYVTGGDPEVSGASPFLLTETATELVLSYPRKHGVPEGSDPAWISDDLENWQPATGLQREVEAIDANTDLIKLHLPLGLGDRKFLRVAYAGDGL